MAREVCCVFCVFLTAWRCAPPWSGRPAVGHLVDGRGCAGRVRENCLQAVYKALADLQEHHGGILQVPEMPKRIRMSENRTLVSIRTTGEFFERIELNTKLKNHAGDVFEDKALFLSRIIGL